MDTNLSEQQGHAAAHAPTPNHGNLMLSAFGAFVYMTVHTFVNLDMILE